MANESIPQFKTPETVRIKNREAKRRWKLRHPEKQRAHQRKQNLKRYHRLRASGLCAMCGKASRPEGRAYCGPCAERDAKRTKTRRDKRGEEGNCTICGRCKSLPAMQNKKYRLCEPCYFKKTSIDCLKTAKHAESIGQKLKDQNYRCAYTGEEIILGLNDSLDHILPISKFPELRSDPANAEWVTRKVNCMKWDSTREEFIATAYAIVRHYESQRQLAA